MSNTVLAFLLPVCRFFFVFFFSLNKLKEMGEKRAMKGLSEIHSHSEEADVVDFAKHKYSAPKNIGLACWAQLFKP